MSSKNPSTKKVCKTAAPQTIGFRLDEQTMQLLVKRANRLGLSVRDLARHYVLLVLDEPEERIALQQFLQRIHQDQLQFRADFTFAVRALLSSAGKATAKEAKAWVEQSITPD